MNQTWKIIIAVVIAAIVVGGGVYFWQRNKQVDTPQITQETETQTTAQAPTTQTEKIFKGSGFSFTYPEKYTADDKGLWTEEGYQRHVNPPAGCDTCQIPEVAVKSVLSTKTLDQQIIADFDLPGTNLKEMTAQTGLSYEQIKLGENNFIKIRVSDLHDVTGYYTKNGNIIVAFSVYFYDRNNQELKDMISTLKFE